jgi:hypothetical protein
MCSRGLWRELGIKAQLHQRLLFAKLSSPWREAQVFRYNFFMRFVSAILFGLFNFVLVRAIVALFGMDVLAARLAQRVLQIPAENIQLIAWGISGVVGTVALVGWIIFHIDERLYGLLSPRPELGSLHQANAILHIQRHQKDNRTDVEMVIDLKNTNNALIAFRSELRATVNGKDLDKPAAFNGFVNANFDTSLILRMEDIPTPVTDGYSLLTARMRYDVTYYLATNKKHARRTSKLVEFQTRFQAFGMTPGARKEEPIHVRFFDEIEE